MIAATSDRYVPDFPKLDLGCGRVPFGGFTGVDKDWGPNIIGWNLLEFPWPWADQSIEALRSSHLIEHLPAYPWQGKDILVRFFEEAWRICKPGALFHLRWPVPFDVQTGAPIPSAWWDPTHYRHIPHEQITSYFWRDGRKAMDVEGYGIRCNWAPTRPIHVRNLTNDGRVQEYDAELRREDL